MALIPHTDDADQPISAKRDAPAVSVETYSDLAAEAYPALWTLAQSIVRNSADAEDVVQDALVTGLGKRDRFEPGTHFLAWMGTIVRNTAMNRLRYESRRTHAAIDAVQEPASDDGQEEPVDRKGRIKSDQQSFDDTLLQALGQLTPVAKACLLLRSQHAMDYVAIGQMMDLAPNTAMSHVHRARRTLRDLLRPSMEAAAAVSATKAKRS